MLQCGSGANQQQRAKLDTNVCAYCGKSGPWQRECRKRQADRKQQMRAVGLGDGDEPKQDTAYSATARVTTASGFQLLVWRRCNIQVCGQTMLRMHSCRASPSSTSNLRIPFRSANMCGPCSAF